MDKKKLDKIKNTNPFSVPERYFECMAQNVMDNLPKKEIKEEEALVISLWDKVKPLVYMAAMFIGAALIIRVMMPSHESDLPELAKDLNIEEVSDEFIQETIDGAMFDDYTMHVYLTNYSE